MAWGPQVATLAPATATALTADQSSAKALITSELAYYGLGSLADRAWNDYLQTGNVDQVMLDLRQSPEYKARFPAMAELSAKGRAISESDYINLERSYTQLGQAYGLPAAFTQSHLTDWIGGEVSPTEVKSRLDMYQADMYQSPPEVRSELSRLYGLSSGDQLAFFIDENRALPILQQQFLAAQAGAASKLSGFGALTQHEAEMVAQSGQNFQQDQQGFDTLAKSQELFSALPGEVGADNIDREDQLGAAFGGNSAAARRIQQQADKRVAEFKGGGGFSQTQGGETGLGSAAS